MSELLKDQIARLSSELKDSHAREVELTRERNEARTTTRTVALSLTGIEFRFVMLRHGREDLHFRTRTLGEWSAWSTIPTLWSSNDEDE